MTNAGQQMDFPSLSEKEVQVCYPPLQEGERARIIGGGERRSIFSINPLKLEGNYPQKIK